MLLLFGEQSTDFLDVCSVWTVPVLARLRRVWWRGEVDSIDQDAKIHSGRLDAVFPFRVEADAIDVTNATVPDSNDEVGEACMAVMG
jgi:hypothetical protein